jgi:hypothetical protein
VTGVHARGCRCAQGRLTALPPRSVTTEQAKQWALIGVEKGHSKPRFTHLPYSSHDVPPIVRDTITISKMGPMIAVGLL